MPNLFQAIVDYVDASLEYRESGSYQAKLDRLDAETRLESSLNNTFLPTNGTVYDLKRGVMYERKDGRIVLSLNL